MEGPVIVAKDLVYYYHYKKQTTIGLNGVNLEINRGQRVVLVGSNGSGKTTLLRSVAGKHKPTSGSLTVLGRDAFSDTVLNKHVSYLGEIWPAGANWSDTVEQTVINWSGVDMNRFYSLCNILSVQPKWRVDHCSAGMKRKIQILLGLLYQRQVICLDEFSTDLDLVERENVLNYLRRQSEELGVTILYATHIFDNISTWPTHVLHMKGAQLVELLPLSTLERPLLSLVNDWIRVDTPIKPDLYEGAFIYPSSEDHSQPSEVVINKLKCRVGRDNQGKFSTSKVIYVDLQLSIPKGSRYLLVGTNGSGKTTLLRAIAGKHFIPKDIIAIEGRDAFHDTKLNSVVGYSGDWWYETEWDLSVKDVIGDKLDERALYLIKVLDIDPEWRMNRVSTGQRKRIQLLVNLHSYRNLLLLDEVTADLDIAQRRDFLAFLYHESKSRGSTIVYSTHIFEEMEGWPTHIAFVDAAGQNIHSIYPCLSTTPFHLVSFIQNTLLELKKKENQQNGTSK